MNRAKQIGNVSVSAPRYDEPLEDDYYPAGVDRDEFDAMVAEEMERLERETRDVMKKPAPSYNDDYDAPYAPPAASKKNVSVPSFSVGSSNLPRPPSNMMSPRDIKRAQQMEYARQLQEDADRKSKGPVDTGSRGSLRSGRSAESTKRAAVVEEDRRRRDANAETDIFGNFTISSRPNSKTALSDSQSAKILKQQEYARQLEQDKYAREKAAAEREEDETTPRKRVLSGRRRTPDADSNQGTGFAIGGSSSRSDAGAKRRNQELYAAQLSQQMAQPPGLPSPRNEKTRRYQAEREEGDNLTSIQLGGYDISTSQKFINKKNQQREYSNELAAASQRAPIASISDDRRSRLAAEESGGNSLMIGSSATTAEQRQMKISEQRRYNRELQEASNMTAVPGLDRKPVARRQEEDEHPLGSGRNSGVFAQQQESSSEARNRKRASQEEYARQLQADVGGVREPNMHVGRAYDNAPYQASPQGKVVAGGTRHSEVIISGRDRGFVGQEKGRFSGAANSHRDDPDILNTKYHKDEEVLEKFRPVAVSARVRDYKDRQTAYAELLAQDAAIRDSARAENGMEDQSSKAMQQQKRAASTGRLRPGRDEVDYSGNQGTGLMIGGMDVTTAAQKQNKRYQQQQYADDIARAKAMQPVPDSYRSIHRDQTEYVGNGLPGGKQISFRQQPGASYHNNIDYQALRSDAQKDGFQIRGTSTGGGRSQIHF